MALDISKAFDSVWHAVLLHKLASYGIVGQVFGLISSFLSNRRLREVLDGKSSHKYPVNARVPQGSVLGPTPFVIYINGVPDDIICNIAIYADDTILYSKYDQASDQWQKPELALNLNLIYEILWTGVRSGFLILMLGKLNWFHLSGVITMVLWENDLLRCWG